MKSRLLTRLDNGIRGASSHSAADCLRCERAAYLARHGNIGAATRELAAVRKRQEESPRTSIVAWVNLAEGLLGIYGQPGAPMRDKVARAYALSKAARLSPLRALAAAWLAHLDLQSHDIESAAQHAAEALALATPQDHGALGRASLVLAQGYDLGGRYDLARPWYAEAHRHATAEGDDAALSAMMWKMATLRVAAWRQALACESVEAAAAHEEPGRHALACAESAALFDRLRGVTSRQALQPVLRAQVCTLMGDTEEALRLFQRHLPLALKQGMRPIEGVLLADRALCRFADGSSDEAAQDAQAAAECLRRVQVHGDRAPGHSRLAQVFAALGNLAAAEQEQVLAAEQWALHRAHQGRVVELLDRVVADNPPGQNSVMLSLRR